MSKMWMKRELALSDEEWSKLSIKEIKQSSTAGGNIIYITFSKQSEVQLI